MITLGIETTCDETGISLIKDGQILSNLISSQAQMHEKFGGVVPELACRKHIDVISPLLNEALNEAKITLSDIDLIAAAYTPGLIGAVLIGLNYAKALALSLNIPFIGVHHIEAHLYGAMMDLCDKELNASFPALGVILSGGHTQVFLIEGIGQYTLLSSTIDDAIGEAFDKVAVMLNLSYPGGPQIEKIAKGCSQDLFKLKAGKIKERPYDFSFSGLKTGMRYRIEALKKERPNGTLNDEDRSHLAYSFQECAFGDVLKKVAHFCSVHQVKALFFGGGVTCNQRLKEVMNKLPIKIHWPAKNLSLDNGAMIAGLGAQLYKIEGQSPLNLDAIARSPITQKQK